MLRVHLLINPCTDEIIYLLRQTLPKKCNSTEIGGNDGDEGNCVMINEEDGADKQKFNFDIDVNDHIGEGII